MSAMEEGSYAERQMKYIYANTPKREKLGEYWYVRRIVGTTTMHYEYWSDLVHNGWDTDRKLAFRFDELRFARAVVGDHVKIVHVTRYRKAKDDPNVTSMHDLIYTNCLCEICVSGRWFTMGRDMGRKEAYAHIVARLRAAAIATLWPSVREALKYAADEIEGWEP